MKIRSRKDGSKYPLAERGTLFAFMDSAAEDRARTLAGTDTRRLARKQTFRQPDPSSLRGDTLNSALIAAENESLLPQEVEMEIDANQDAEYDSGNYQGMALDVPPVQLDEIPEDSEAWIAQKSKEYGGRNLFLSSEEYRRAYPILKKRDDAKLAVVQDRAHQAMNEAGARYGDKVEYSGASPFGQIYEYEGILTQSKKGLPVVKLTKKPPEHKGTTTRWHKGYRKMK